MKKTLRWIIGFVVGVIVIPAVPFACANEFARRDYE